MIGEVELEGLAFKLLALLNFHFKGFDCLGNGILVQIAGFGEVDGDTTVDVGSCDVVDFLQGHTGLFIGVRSSGAGNGQNVGGLGNDSLFLGERGKPEPLGLQGFGDTALVEILAVFHDDGGTEAGKKDFIDAVLGFESQTGPVGDASSLAAYLDDIDGGGVGCSDIGGFLGCSRCGIDGKHRKHGEPEGSHAGSGGS